MPVSSQMRMILSSALLLFAAWGTAGAVTLGEYMQNVDDSRGVVRKMYSDLFISDDVGRINRFDAEKLNALRQLLPAASEVETQTGKQEFSNAWLHTRLDEFVTANSIEERAAILIEIDERLRAIKTRISELHEATNGTRSKDEEKRKLAEILRREEYQPPSEKKGSWVEKMLLDLLEWLQGFQPRQQRAPAIFPGLPAIAFWLQIALFVIVAGLLGFLVYKLSPIIFPLFRSKKRIKREKRVILGEHIDENESSEDLFSEAELLARSGDIRAAIRKGYIAFLCELNDRKLVGLARHKTNRDYLREVRQRDELHRKMQELTFVFEKHWYGAKPSSEAVWQTFRAGCREALSRI